MKQLKLEDRKSKIEGLRCMAKAQQLYKRSFPGGSSPRPSLWEFIYEPGEDAAEVTPPLLGKPGPAQPVVGRIKVPCKYACTETHTVLLYEERQLRFNKTQTSLGEQTVIMGMMRCPKIPVPVWIEFTEKGEAEIDAQKEGHFETGEV